MISKVKLEKGVNGEIYFNTYRPNLRKDIDFEFWGSVHTHVKKCDYPIIVSSVFWTVEGCLEKHQGFEGGGKKYLFWFENEDDRNKFRTFIFELTDSIEDYTVPTWMRASKDGIPQSEKLGKSRETEETPVVDAYRWIKTMYKGKSTWVKQMGIDNCRCVFTEENGKRVYINKCKNCRNKEKLREPETM